MLADKVPSRTPAIFRYGFALACTGLAVLLRLLMLGTLGPRQPGLPFFLAFLLTSWYGGLGPALLSIALGTAATQYFAAGDTSVRPFPFLLVTLLIAAMMEAQQRAQRRLRAAVDQRRRAEDAEERQRQWSQTALASIGDAVITTDVRGRINFMNAVAEGLTGWMLGEANGESLEKIFRIVNLETRVPVANPTDRVLREGVTVGLANHTALITKDGREIPIDDSGAPIRNERGEVIGAVLVFRDVTARRRAMSEIRESQQRLQAALEDLRRTKDRVSSILESISDAFLAVDREWRFTYLNEAIVNAAGRPREQLLQRTIWEVFPEMRDTELERQFERVMSERVPSHFEVNHGGQWLEVHAHPTEEGLSAYVLNINSRKKAESELKVRLVQQGAVARVGALAISIRDEGRLMLSAVSVVAGELGVEFAAVMETLPGGKGFALRAAFGWPVAIEPGTVMPGWEGSQAAYTLAAGAPVVVESYESESRFQLLPVLQEAQAASGISVVIPGDDGAFGVLCAHSKRHRAFSPDDARFLQSVANILGNAIRRQREEEARERLAAILESSEDAIVGKSQDGIVETWNHGAERIYGYSAEEIIGRPIALLLPSDRPDEEKEILDRIQRGERVQSFETMRVRKDGVAIHVSLTISPVRDRAGRIRGASHIARDISERKRIEEKLRQAQKLESLGVLAGGIAHDFNNLLTGVLGNASLIADLAPPDSPLRDLSAGVIQAAERAAHLTRQILAYSGRGRFLIQPMDCGRHVREITALVQASIPKNVEVRLVLAAGLPAIDADEGQFQQLIMNLVINAAEALSGAPGSVTISTRLAEVRENSAARLTYGGELKPGQYVSIEVRDTGSGMDAETQTKIFDPFFTTKFMGRGLGLAAALGIVRGHGGGIRVSSAPGRGTTFQVLFPVSARYLQPPAEEPEPRAGGNTILVVDDQEVVRRAAKAGLEKYGYRILLAEDGEQALEIFRSRKNEIDLVLLDMTMPVLSGELAFRELRGMRPDLPVLASSGYSEAEAMERFGVGVTGFVQKPYSARTLAEKVAEAFGQRSKSCEGGAG